MKRKSSQRIKHSKNATPFCIQAEIWNTGSPGLEFRMYSVLDSSNVLVFPLRRKDIIEKVPNMVSLEN